MRAIITFVAVGVALTACQPSETLTELSSFANLLEGEFATSPNNKDTIIRDRRVRVNSQALEGVWFYTQLNTGEEGNLYRQRLSKITWDNQAGTIIQTAYGLKNPEKFIDAWESPQLLNTMTADDIEPYFQKGCEQVWTKKSSDLWQGYVDPKTCIIASKRGGVEIRIESEGVLSKSQYQTTERGYDMDMNFLWGSKPGEMITLYPVR